MGMIPEEVIQQVLDRNDIVDVIAGYIPVKKAGRNFKALCPFHHEKTPSFVINPEKQIFHCFGCGVGGNVLSFVMKHERFDFPEAIRQLADKGGVVIPESDRDASQSSQLRQQIYQVNETAADFFHKFLLSDRSSTAAAAREYLKNRQLSLETVKKFRIGLASDAWDDLLNFFAKQGIGPEILEPAGLIIARSGGYYDRFRSRIMFPIFDVRRRCIAFGGRTLEKDNPAKYINSPETPVYTKGRHLYGLHLCRDEITRNDQVIVVEGYMDVVIPFQAGISTIVASLGTALTVDQIRLLSRYTQNIVLIFDADQAGESAMMRSLDLFLTEGVEVKLASLPSGEDPDSFVRVNGREAFLERVSKAEPIFDYKLNTLIRKFGTGSLESRMKISHEMLPMIARVSNAIVREDWIRRLAQILSTSIAAIVAELRKVQRSEGGDSAPREFPKTSAGEDISVSFSSVERHLLTILLHDHSLLDYVRARLNPEDLPGQKTREVLSRLFALADKGGEIHVPQLISSFEDPQLAQWIVGLMVQEDDVVGDRRKMVDDCLVRLSQDRRKRLHTQIHQQIQQAQAAGDRSRLDELTQQLNQLIKG